MEYQGRLFGKVGKKYFPLLATAEDFDKLKKERDELLACLNEAVQAFDEPTIETDFPKFSAMRRMKELTKSITP